MGLALLSAFIFACVVMGVDGHAYMYFPPSRQYLNDQRHMHSNGGEKTGVKGVTSKWGSGPDLRNGAIPADRFAWDICGTNIEGDSWTFEGVGDKPTATYKQGGNITFIIVVNGEHGGLYDFRLCPKKIQKGMSVKEAAECLDTYLIGRTCVTSDDCTTEGCKSGCGCGDDKCRDFNLHRDKDDPIYTQNGEYREPFHLEHGAHVLTFQLPKELHCEECTVQWYWPTAYNENFRSCADIKIEKAAAGGGGDESRRRKSGGGDGDESRRRKSESRRRKSTETTPKPESRRRRRTKEITRRRKGPKESSRRRRRSKGCSDKAVAANAVETPTQIAEFAVDMEYEKLGCFPLSKGDGAAEKLHCDCDTGDGHREVDTLRDLTCMNHTGADAGPCRSGLPFYRMHMDRSVAVGLCFRFCSSKGLDLFGLVGEIECRCGASYANSKFWNYAKEPPSSLVLDTSTKLETCSADSAQVYRYIGWMRYKGADGVQKAMLDLGPTDKEYLATIINGKKTPSLMSITPS